MIQNSRDLADQIETKLDRVVAIATRAKDEGRQYTEEESSEVESLNAEIEIDKQLFFATREKEKDIRSQAASRGHEKLQNRIDESFEGERKVNKYKTQAGKSIFANEKDAYNAGQFYAATLFGSKRAEKYCNDHGLIKNSMIEGDDLRGGSVVSEQLESTIVELREQFGVFRSEATVVPMSSDVTVIPKTVGELTSYYVSEMAAITPSDMTLTQLRLTAKKLATLTAVSSELDEDAIVSIGETLTRSIAYSFSLKEDQAGFLGDGSVTYGGIMGLSNILAAGSTVTATSRQTFGALTMADFEGCVGKVKQWAGSTPKWYISQQGWANSMQRLLNAAGGNDLSLLAMGPTKMFMGYPVVISQVLPQALTGTTGTLACFFGDLRQGVYMGSRRGVTVRTDSSIFFNQDALAVRATERYDINCHDTGDASNAGGIVKLIFG